MSNMKITRRRVLKGAVTVAAASVIPGFARKAEGQTPQPVPQQSLVVMTITMGSSAQGFVKSDFIGLSYAKDWLTNTAYYLGGTGPATRLFDPNSTNLMNFFVTANVRWLRLADSSDKVYVGTDGNGMVGNQIAESDINALAKFLSASGMNPQGYKCSCLYGVNLEGALRDPNVSGDPVPTGVQQTSPTLAYDEVTYAAGSNGLSTWFGGVEIGNEINCYQSSSGPLSLTYNGTNWKLSTTPYMATLESAWETYRSNILLSPNQSLQITGPAFDTQNINQWNEAEGIGPNNWDPVQFAKDEGAKSNLNLLTQHYYTGDSHSGSTGGYTPASWYGATNTVNNDYEPGLLLPSCNADSWTNPGTNKLQYLYLAHYLLPQLNGNGEVHYRISECNSYFNGGAQNYSNAYGSALWAIDFMCTCAQWYSNGVNFHGGGNAQIGDPWYTPISNSIDPTTKELDLQANPLYYGIVMFALAIQGIQSGYGNMYPITLGVPNGDTTGPYLNGYAIQTGPSAYSILINNKYTEAYKAKLTLPGSLQVVTSQVYQLTNSTAVPNETSPGTVLSDSGNNTQIQGQTVGTNGLFSPALAPYSQNLDPVYVWPLSTLLIQITTSGAI